MKTERRPLTDEEKERIIELRRAGRQLDAIASEVGCSASAVSKTLRRAGLTKRGQVPVTGEALQARRQRVRELVEEGRSDREVAAILGTTKTIVRTDRQTLGLPANIGERALPGDHDAVVEFIEPDRPTSAARFIERAASSSGSWRVEHRDGLHAPDQRIAFTTSHRHVRPTESDEAELEAELKEAERRASESWAA